MPSRVELIEHAARLECLVEFLIQRAERQIEAPSEWSQEALESVIQRAKAELAKGVLA